MRLYALLFLLIFLLACSKEKVENIIPILPVANAPASGIRLFNITNNSAQITVNNIPLTSYGNTSTAIGLQYFPKGFWPDASTNGGPFVIPATLLDKQNKAHLNITATLSSSVGGNTSQVFIDTTITNDQLHPIDYFLGFDGHFTKAQHPITAPAGANNFKIRVLNLSQLPDTLSLQGSFSLTYANAHKVNSVTNDVPLGQSSAYIELPAGPYAFKVFVSNSGTLDFTKQLSNVPYNIPNYDINDLQILKEQYYLYPPVLTYKAGATYTLLITRNLFVYTARNDAKYFVYTNAYRVIQDNNVPANQVYALIQGANAIPDKPIQLTIDGAPMSGSLLQSELSTQFSAVVTGYHTFSVIDQSGTVLATKKRYLNPNDYVTAWAYHSKGRYDIIFADNDVTSTIYIGNNPYKGDLINGATDGKLLTTSYQINSPWQCRFLNLSEDLDYATFTNNLSLFSRTYTQGIDSETINLSQGLAINNDPYLITLPFTSQNNNRLSFPAPLSVAPASLRTFQSSPGPPAIVPGTLRLDIPVLSPNKFVADSTLYTSIGIAPSLGEPGLYTVALIGSVSDGNAHLFVVKHNQ